MRRTSSPSQRPSTAKFGARLSPRRKLYLERLLQYVWWHASKVHFDERTYLEIEQEQNLDRFGTNQAIDDGYALGLVDVTINYAGIQTVMLLSRNLEDAA